MGGLLRALCYLKSVSQREKGTSGSHIHVKSKNIKFIETENRQLLALGLRGVENGEMVAKEYNLSVKRYINSSLRTRANNSLLYTRQLL